MQPALQKVAETSGFIRDAESERLSQAGRVALTLLLAADPEAGDLIVGSGGIRKLRVAGRGRGKSGGFRVLTAHVGPDAPVYLLALLGKGDRENFTKDEIGQFADLTTSIRKYWKRRRSGSS